MRDREPLWVIVPEASLHETREYIEGDELFSRNETRFFDDIALFIGYMAKVDFATDWMALNPVLTDSPTRIEELFDISNFSCFYPQTRFFEALTFGAIHEAFFAFGSSTRWHPEIVHARNAMLHEKDTIILCHKGSG